MQLICSSQDTLQMFGFSQGFVFFLNSMGFPLPSLSHHTIYLLKKLVYLIECFKVSLLTVSYHASLSYAFPVNW